jgi:UDP-2-acetamido-2-deoxy-ribo-hexuluronate aminotransferase
LHVIEDTAQAIGADYYFSDKSSKKAGTIGTIGTTSFFPSKNLGCFGDGGALFVSDDELAEKIRMIANHGQKQKYYHDIIGVNSRLDTLQAGILSVKLKQLDHYSKTRNEVASFYDNAFKNKDKIITPVRMAYSSHVFHQYTLIIKQGNRDEIKAKLAAKGIPTMVYYPVPLHLQEAYKYYPVHNVLSVSENLCNLVLSLPIHTEMTEDELDYISFSVLQVLG